MDRQRSVSLWILVALLGCAAAPGGCNALTGADDYTIDNDSDDDDDGDDDGNDGPSGPGGPTGGETTGGETTGGEATSSGGSTGEQPGTLGAAPGVYITEVALYQAVKRPLMQGGQPASSSVPVVAGRDALVRVFTSVDGGYDGAPVTARLFVGEGSAPIELTQSVGASSDATLGSTLNFAVPGSAITQGAGWRVEIGRAGGAGGPSAYWPGTGFEPLGAQSVGASLKVHLIPVSYGADGSNRLPDISGDQIERYRSRFYAMYPAPQVEITVHQAVGWNNGIYPNGSGWDSLLNAIASLREDENAANDVYYYGIFAPASNIGAFCGGGCVAGLGMIGGPSDSYSRAAIGLGFGGDDSTDTAVHEIGHTHGREHAPCQVGNADPSYPYSGGASGVWGYDLIKQQLHGPNTPDLMGYCFPFWISDYNYKAFASRMQFVNGAQVSIPTEKMNLTYDRVAVGADGEATWLDPIELRTPPLGESTEVAVSTEQGDEVVDGAFFPYDHLPGGVLLVQRPAAGIIAVSASLAGKFVLATKP
jgi:hypothetical protein